MPSGDITRYVASPMSNAHYVKVGWWLFVVSALLFLWSSIRAGSWIAAAGAGVFLIADIIFLIPVYRGGRTTEAAADERRSDGVDQRSPPPTY